MGKTQLSLEYCLRAIFWLDARNTLYGSIETAAKQLLPDRVFDNPQADTGVTLVKDDNLDNPDDLHGIINFFPANRHGYILVMLPLTESYSYCRCQYGSIYHLLNKTGFTLL